MFSKQVRTIFRVLGEALLTLATMPADTEDHKEMSGAQYIKTLDNPNVGLEPTSTAACTAAQVFGTSVAVQAAPPTYTMTDKAKGFTREQYHDSNWTDEALIADGYMIVTPAPVALDTRPNAPPAPVAGTPLASSAQATASTQVAAPAAPTNTVALQPAGAVTVDSSGLPWDGRIHSSSRTANADGAWKKKKGVSDIEVARVTGELRSSGGTPVAAPFTPLAGAPAPAAPAPAAQSVAAAAPTHVPAPPAPATGATDAPTTFTELCKWITANGFTMIQALEHAKQFGIEAMGFLAQPSNASIIPLVHAELAKLRK